MWECNVVQVCIQREFDSFIIKALCWVKLIYICKWHLTAYFISVWSKYLNKFHHFMYLSVFFTLKWINFKLQLSNSHCCILSINNSTFTSQYPLTTHTTSAISNYNLPTYTVTYFQSTILYLHRSIPRPHGHYTRHNCYISFSYIWQLFPHQFI